MAGGGEHHHAEGDFRQKVWSLTGGPNCRPKHWRRNTAIAMAGIVLICIPIAMKSSELEQRPHLPPTEEEAELEKIFKKFDADGDGKISVKDLSDILKSLGSATSTGDAASIMSELDVNGDGFIDLKEFKAFQHDGGGDSKKELKEAFDLYEKDKNGNISATELHSTLRSLGEKCSIKDCRKMISSVDDRLRRIRIEERE